MPPGPVIALIDGEHHPAAVRDSLDRLEGERGLAGVVFVGGEEKLPRDWSGRAEELYGRPVRGGGFDALYAFAEATDAVAVVDLADEPVLNTRRRLRLAAYVLHLGLDWEAPGARLTAPRYEKVDFDGPKLAVIGTGKRTGKTAVAGHWAGLLRDRGRSPVVVCMGRGGPAEPAVARPETGLADLLELAEGGRHAASDYLEDAVLAGVPTVGCRRVGGGLVGEPGESNVPEGARLAATLGADRMLLEGSGSSIPPVEVDGTVLVVGDRRTLLDGLGPYRLLRADLVLLNGEGELEAAEALNLPQVVFELRPEPAEEIPAGARVALFSTGPARPEGIEPVVASTALARRPALESDLDAAAAEGCDVYLTELKAAAIDTVAARARREGARVVFLRNRPVGLDANLDTALLGLSGDA